MNFWLLIWMAIVVVYCCIQIVSWLALSIRQFRPKATWKEWPKVSVLLAARNEEKLILRSLRSLAGLDYPAEKLQILIGDDRSEDHTLPLIKQFIAGSPNFILIPVIKNLGAGRGKANVLAHLALKAEGEFLFITDVDVELPPLWIKNLLAEFTDEVGIISGTTICETGNSFETMQAIDWLHFMGFIKSFANLGVSCTSVGNNMAVRAEAYRQTGGYEKMPFSITEDYRLFKEVTKNGWQWRNVLEAGSLGKAKAIDSLIEMFHQRKRWLIGAKELPWNWKVLIFLYGLFMPLIWLTLVFYPVYSLLLWGIKFFIQCGFISSLCKKAGIKSFSLSSLFLYEIYVDLNTVITAIFFLLPFKTVWKGRQYRANDLVDVDL
jgi:cellulose synthase/poly-beta-1,6-N-acetylglucosamine synthase-like glycosyltransferase